MERLFKHPGLYIGESELNGYGVFTDKTIGVGELIEQMPVHKRKIPYTWIQKLFDEGEDGPMFGFDKGLQHFFPYLHPDASEPIEYYWLGSGFCMHLNNSMEDPGNVAWVIKEKDCDCPEEHDMASFFATAPIFPGDEITFPYMHYETYDTYKQTVLDSWNIKKKN